MGSEYVLAMGIALAFCGAVPASAQLVGDGDRRPQHVAQGLETDTEKCAAAAVVSNRLRLVVLEAAKALGKGDYAKTHELCAKVLQQDPRQIEAQLLVAVAYERQGKDAEALRSYRSLILPRGAGGSIGDDVSTQMRYILVLTRNGRWRDAVAMYDYAMGLVQSQYGERVFAAARFDARVPNKAGLESLAHLVLGADRPTYGELVPEDYRKQLDQVTSLQPIWIDAQLLFGEALVRERCFERAQPAFEAAAKSDDGNVRRRAREGLRSVASYRASEAQKAREAAARCPQSGDDKK